MNDHLARASAIVATWPDWKRNLLGRTRAQMPDPTPTPTAAAMTAARAARTHYGETGHLTIEEFAEIIDRELALPEIIAVLEIAKCHQCAGHGELWCYHSNRSVVCQRCDGKGQTPAVLAALRKLKWEKK